MWTSNRILQNLLILTIMIYAAFQVKQIIRIISGFRLICCTYFLNNSVNFSPIQMVLLGINITKKVKKVQIIQHLLRPLPWVILEAKLKNKTPNSFRSAPLLIWAFVPAGLQVRKISYFTWKRNCEKFSLSSFDYEFLFAFLLQLLSTIQTCRIS